jgi:uncharacterized membrane protein YgcG
MFRRFNASKCKTQCKLCVSRVKLMRNKKQLQMKQMRKEVADLIKNGRQSNARIRVEAVIREQLTLQAYEIIELFLELLAVRAQLVEQTKEMPPDMWEAMSSLVYASHRMQDFQELTAIRAMLASKYGKEYVTEAAGDLLCRKWHVNEDLIKCLAVAAPDPEDKLACLSDIAQEHGVDWDANAAAQEMLPGSRSPASFDARFGPGSGSGTPSYGGGGAGGSSSYGGGGGGGYAAAVPNNAPFLPGGPPPGATVGGAGRWAGVQPATAAPQPMPQQQNPYLPPTTQIPPPFPTSQIPPAFTVGGVGNFTAGGAGNFDAGTGQSAGGAPSAAAPALQRPSQTQPQQPAARPPYPPAQSRPPQQPQQYQPPGPSETAPEPSADSAFQIGRREFGGRTESEVQRAYDEAPAPPQKEHAHQPESPSAPLSPTAASEPEPPTWPLDHSSLNTNLPAVPTSQPTSAQQQRNNSNSELEELAKRFEALKRR